MKINKIIVDRSILDEQAKMYGIKFGGIGSNIKLNQIEFFGDILIPNTFNKELRLKVIIYNKTGKICGTSCFDGINKNNQYLTFFIQFYDYLEDKENWTSKKLQEESIVKAKFFLVEQNQWWKGKILYV